MTAVNRLRNFKIIIAGVGLVGQGKAALQALGGIGDSDIKFYDLRDASGEISLYFFPSHQDILSSFCRALATL